MVSRSQGHGQFTKCHRLLFVPRERSGSGIAGSGFAILEVVLVAVAVSAGQGCGGSDSG